MKTRNKTTIQLLLDVVVVAAVVVAAATAATAGAAVSRRRELLDFLCDRRFEIGAGESPLASSVRGDVDDALRGDERDERERAERSRARGDLLS